MSEAVAPVADFDPADFEQTIPQRFCQHVERRGDRPALGTPDGEMTYAELNAAANRLAHAILAEGGEVGGLLGLLLDDDASMVIGWLAVLKAGRVCVPLALSSPVARLAYIVEYSAPAAILTNARHLELAKQLTQGKVPILNLDALDLPQWPDTNPQIVIPPASAAYILYTSGSTGRPKGVVHAHRNVMRNVQTLGRGLGLTPDDRLAALVSFSMGQGVATKVLALMSGAAVFPFPLKEQGIGPLAAWMNERRITIYTSAVTVFRHFARSLPPGFSLPHLRVLRLGAEALRSEDVRLFQEKFAPGCLILNSLSCTETMNYAQYRVTHDTVVEGAIVPGGYPVPGMEVLLRDENGREVGLDREGEIHVRSGYVALGYWHDPERTREAFVEEPDGRRTYRTGDMAKRRADGRIDYSGRKDFQIKVRGYRVELIEIESSLGAHPEVLSAVVEARRDEQGDTLLVAHIEPKESGAPTAKVLREHLRLLVPEYMVPAAFVIHAALPLAPSGKPDRTALATVPLPVETETQAVLPRTPLEENLFKIWKDLLPGRSFGVTDNFFDVGGNSLLAAQLLVRLDRDLHITVTLHDLYRHPAIERLSQRITSGPLGSGFTSLITLGTEGRETPLFIIHGWGGTVFQLYGFARRLVGNRPVHALQAVEFSGQPRQRTYEEMARHYVDEIVRLQPTGSYDLLGYSLGGMISWAVAQELARRGLPVGRIFIVDTMPKNLPLGAHLRMVRSDLWRHPKQQLKTLWAMLARRVGVPRSWWLKETEHPGVPKAGEIPVEVRPGQDYYQVAGSPYIPRRGAFDVRLLASAQEPCDLVAGWEYLTGRKIEPVRLSAPHHDLFFAEHLDELVAAFRVACERE